MIVSIKSKGFKLILPVPLFMGGVAIKFIPQKYLDSNEKKIAVEGFKAVKKSLKGYKGLKILEVSSHDGEHIVIKI